jgi:pimeloyl-ACP methyl ester carboxylesterase
MEFRVLRMFETLRCRATAFLMLLTITASLCGQRPVWRDPSTHRVHFINIEDGVRLEVLDWGGSGKPLVLVAGSGNTAHVFDGFAEKLTRTAHVYGITRRGFGASSHPESEYTDQRLSDDVLQVLNFLHLVAPVLVGHSLGGNELTTLASEHPNRVSGLIYLDATFDPKDLPTNDPKYVALLNNLPPNLLPHPPGFPESERQAIAHQNVRHAVSAIAKGVKKRDYSGIRVPVLALVATFRAADDQLRNDMPKDPEPRAAIEAYEVIRMVYIKKDEETLRAAVPNAHIVELPGANHYVFLSNEPDVLGEIDLFLSRLLP